MRSRGHLITIRECDWTQQLKTMTEEATHIPRILLQDNEASLLKAIQENKVYGFVTLDLDTPEKVRKDFGSFLFPPLISRRDLTIDHLSPYMQRRIIEEEGQR